MIVYLALWSGHEDTGIVGIFESETEARENATDAYFREKFAIAVGYEVRLLGQRAPLSVKRWEPSQKVCPTCRADWDFMFSCENCNQTGRVPSDGGTEDLDW